MTRQSKGKNGHSNDTNGQPNGTNGQFNSTNGHSNGINGYPSGTNGHSNGTNVHFNGTNGHSNGTNGHSNGTNGHSNGTNGHSNGLDCQLNCVNGHPSGRLDGFDEPIGLEMTATSYDVGENETNGVITDVHNGITIDCIESDTVNRASAGFHQESINALPRLQKPFQPVAICGMACRLPGGVHSPSELWSFLEAGRDARGPVPPSRYNISAFHSPDKKPGSVIAREGYFLDSTNDLAALDTTFFSMSRNEVETLDPQQRMLLEVTHEALDDAGATRWKGSNIGVYVGSYGQDWYDVSVRDTQAHGVYQILGPHDFMVSNRISHELDLHGPSMTIRTACSGSLIGINEACLAIARGDCTSAIVGGTNIIMAPAVTAAETQQGVLSPDGSCNVFSDKTNGYARGEGIVAIYLKPLSEAISDGNPVRAVITGSATNHNGHTPTVARPSSKAQERLIRQAYHNAGITDIARTGFFECHGTGTSTGDPIETAAVSACFGKAGVYIGSVKANLGHAEGAAGLVGILKAVLALEHRTIPPQIKSLPRNPAIDGNLIIPTKPTPWPEDRDERVSVSSFGLGGSNAHAIIESAANFGVTRKFDTSKRVAANAPHLLLFSANTPASVKATVDKYEAFLDRSPDLLADVSYTLANKREHRSYRTFAVCTSDELTLAGTAPPTNAEQNQETSLVMVFTGQGAQWARMGYELLRSETHTVFSNTIAFLDKVLRELGPLAPSWSIDEELRKPARKSRVDEAEFSQPLCTALQIALVDSYASIGIRPAAVVGHSSGEVAAAYASGGLSAREAILVSFLRGLVVAKRQSRQGAMGALGLSWDAAKKHILPGVVLACDNSPSSVTISGDAGPVQETVRNIKQSGSGVLATQLKVERAYHSPHMAEIGGEYQASMTAAGIEGKVHTIPFYSSVSGELFTPAAKSRFGPRYWRTNLEYPVLFTSAVNSVIEQQNGLSKKVFLEIGPHAVLAGPLRQILSHKSSNASYISTLTRRTDSAVNWLSALGQLYVQHVPFDLKALMPAGSALSDLPTYSWDHHRSHWSESRVAREWRMRKHPHHDLLGSKLPETTDIEPVWRNVLHIENAPWIRDHKINADVIFPFAGYIAMAAEAIRQITGIEEVVELRNIVVPTALVLNESSPKEIVTTLHQLRLTDSLDSEWWEFRIASHNGNTWTKHCSGEIKARDEKGVSRNRPVLQDLPRKVSSKRWYDAMRRESIDYGHHFMSLEGITTATTGARLARANVRNNWHGDEHFYHLHPVILDSYLQLLSIAARYGLTHDYCQVIPASIGSLVLRRSAVSDLIVTAIAEPAGNKVRGTGMITADGEAVIEVSDVRLTSFSNGDGEERAPIAARSEWVPHIEAEALAALVKPTRDDQVYTATLFEFVGLSVIASQRSTTGIEVIPQLQRYKTWLDKIVSHPHRPEDDFDTLNARIKFLAESLASTPLAPISKAIDVVTDNAPDILSGRKKAFEVLDAGDTLGKFNRLLEGFNGSAFFHRLGHHKPNLRVLELSAGVGSATANIIKDLTRPDGQVLFSHYVISDPSPGRVETLKTRFQGHRNVAFEILDLGIDTELQNFDEKDFDLIIAAGVLQNTPKLSESLARVHQLLAPSGRVLLQSLRPDLLWSRYVLGSLPEWDIGIDDGRADEPYVDVNTWKKRLVTADLQICGEPAFDSDEVTHTSHVIIAKPRRHHLPAMNVTILSETSAESSGSHPITQELRARGYDISYCNLADTPPPGQDIIALLDRETSFLDQLDASKFAQLRLFIGNVTNSGILWITQPCQSQCTNPNFGQIHGLARCMRSELGIAFATCEADDLESMQACQAVVDVFQAFSERIDDEEIEPDFEYVVENGLMRVNRFFPVSSTVDVAVIETAKDSCLTITQPGRLDTLHWEGKALPALQGDEVEVEIHVAGLNFRDVLVAMGIIELFPPSFGYEATGIVRRVGPMARKLDVGDRIALTGVDLLSSTMTITEKLCERLPDMLDFVNGATMPLVFATAIYSLINVGGLEKDQSILIHSGCGGVGLAAIQLASMIGAEIYTTVSSQKKIDFLMKEFDIPRDHIFNSRNVSFEEDLLRETNGRGVDLALNSLSGELLHATWRCVAKWGTLVEIGKRDLLGGGKLNMDVFLANRSYRCVDVDQMCKERPEMIGRLLQSMMQFFRDGHIRAISIDKIFPGVKVQEAFQHMQQGSHIGKILLQLREPTTGQPHLGHIRSANKNTAPVLDSSASYLLVGGLGGLGRSVAVWMIQHGARHLTFLSRTAGTTDSDRLFIEEIQSMGCHVHLVRGSVTNVADVNRAVAESPCPLKGVLQMTMVLHDQAWEKMTIDEWIGATAPKVKGTWNLHNETQLQNLDFFILFSSLSGIVGQPGQANYASGNTFLDAFVKFRTDQGLPCTSLNIGAVEGAGYLIDNEVLLKKMKGTGWRAVQETELLDVLGSFMRPWSSASAQDRIESDVGPTSNLVNPNNILVGIAPVIPLSNPDSSAKLRKDVRMSVFRNIRSEAKSGASSDILRQFLNAAKSNPETLSTAESVMLLSQEIGRKLLGLVLRPVDGEIDVSLSLAQLGLDSMVAVEMRAWWKQMFGLDISVMEMLSMSTLEGLGKLAATGIIARDS